MCEHEEHISKSGGFSRGERKQLAQNHTARLLSFASKSGMSGEQTGWGTVIPFTTFHPGGGAQEWQTADLEHGGSSCLVSSTFQTVPWSSGFGVVFSASCNHPNISAGGTPFKLQIFCLHLLLRSACLANFPVPRVNISLSCKITGGKDCVTVGMSGGSTGAWGSSHGRSLLIERVSLPMEEGEAIARASSAGGGAAGTAISGDGTWPCLGRSWHTLPGGKTVRGRVGEGDYRGKHFCLDCPTVNAFPIE